MKRLQRLFSFIALLVIDSSIKKKPNIALNCRLAESDTKYRPRSYFERLRPPRHITIFSILNRKKIFSKFLTYPNNAFRCTLSANRAPTTRTEAHLKKPTPPLMPRRSRDIASAVTLICCLPGVSVNKLKRREKGDTSEKQGGIGLTVELTARANTTKPSQFTPGD